MQELKLNTDSYPFAQSYEGLNRSQLLSIIDLFDKNLPKPKFIKMALEILLPFPEILKKHRKQLNWKAIAFKADAKAYLKYLLKDTIEFLFKINLSKDVLKWIDIQGIRYYQPNEYLQNISIGQWSYAHTELFAYQQNQDEVHLDRLLAILYLVNPKEFEEEKIQEKALIFKPVSKTLKQFCLTYISQNWQAVYQRYKESVFRSPKNEGENPEVLEAPNWNPILFFVAKTGVFGNIEQVFKANFLSVLQFLEDEDKNAQSLQTQTPQENEE